MRNRLTVDQFAAEVPIWYSKYTEWPSFEQYNDIEATLSKKARDKGYLEKCDIMKIVDWGGDEDRYQLGTKICQMNTDVSVIHHTREAIQQLNSPKDALKSLLNIHNMGSTYCSKTLRCICPEIYPALDTHTRSACKDFLPEIDEGNEQSKIDEYSSFIEICHWIQGKVSVTGPREGGLWFIADIEMALFEFAKSGNKARLVM